MNSELLKLASEANEAALEFRSVIETDDSEITVAAFRAIDALLKSVDKLTGAIVEEANQ